MNPSKSKQAPVPASSQEFMALADLARSRLTPKDLYVQALPDENGKGFDEPVLGYRVLYRAATSTATALTEPRQVRRPQGPRKQVWFRSDLHRQRWQQSARKLVVEGEKKTASGVKYLGLDACGIGGCWGFSRHRAPLPEIFDDIRAGDRIDLVEMVTLRTRRRTLAGAARRFVEYAQARAKPPCASFGSAARRTANVLASMTGSHPSWTRSWTRRTSRAVRRA